MSYSYQTERQSLFTEDGQKMFLAIRDRVKQLLKEAGAVRFQEATSRICGDSWQMLACFDRLVELGEIRELQTNGPGQHRVFIESYARARGEQP